MLKIVKHCKDALPHLVSGALLGLDQKGVLEITHSFPGMSAATAGGEGLGEVRRSNSCEANLEEKKRAEANTFHLKSLVRGSGKCLQEEA